MEEYKSPEGYDFTGANSFDELYAMIRKFGMVQGTQENFGAETLIEIIENVRKQVEGYKLTDITRTGQLRDTVEKLMIFETPSDKPDTIN